MTREEYLEGCSLAELSAMYLNDQISLDEYTKTVEKRDAEETIS